MTIPTYVEPTRGAASALEDTTYKLSRPAISKRHFSCFVVESLPQAFSTSFLVHSEALVVDPHFELYTDLEEGRPKPVGLQVRLYAEDEKIEAFQSYLAEITHLFRQMFGQDDRQAVLQPQYGNTYDSLRELSYLQSEARLAHTLVLQVDEFWAESRSELRRQERYLNARMVDQARKPIRTEDPFGFFGLTASMEKRFPGRSLEPHPETVAAASEFLCRQGLANRVSVIQADMVSYFQQLAIHPAPDAIIFAFVLHELVGPENDDELARILCAIRKA